jgi:hypothetical protein
MHGSFATLIALATALLAILFAVDAAAQEGAIMPPPPTADPAACADRSPAIDLALYADYVLAASRRQRQLEQLYRVMAVEGPEFSEERYAAYRARMAGGILLMALGGSSVFAAMVTGIALEPGASSADGEYDGSGSSDRDPLATGLPIGLALGGIASIAIGLPLTITGARGKHRQELLRRKYEILAPYEPPAVSLSLYADPAAGEGGLQVKVTF